MQTITLTIPNISRLLVIEKLLSNNEALEPGDSQFLSQILRQIPEIELIPASGITLAELFNIDVCDSEHLHKNLERWTTLFSNIPGWDDAAFFYLVEDKDLLKQKVIAIGNFAPSMSYNLNSLNPSYEVRFKDDGTASFWFPTNEDAEKHRDLASFSGSWKDAYFAMIETLKAGWPFNQFPDELRQFLKNE